MATSYYQKLLENQLLLSRAQQPPVTPTSTNKGDTPSLAEKEVENKPKKVAAKRSSTKRQPKKQQQEEGSEPASTDNAAPPTDDKTEN